MVLLYLQFFSLARELAEFFQTEPSASKDKRQSPAPSLRECLTAACKAFSLANAKGKGVDELVIKSLDD